MSEALLRSGEFWRFYLSGEAEEAEEAPPGALAEEAEAAGEEPLRLRLEGPAPRALVIEIDAELAFLSLSLEAAPGVPAGELGWLDEARAHPFALRWEEAEALHRYWAEGRPEACPGGADAGLALLAPFVGTGVEERAALPERRARLAAALERLGLPAPEAARLAEAGLQVPDEEDYRWSRDPRLGWVFGGDYPCYSLRNPEHAGGGEGRFPFAEWAALVRELGP